MRIVTYYESLQDGNLLRIKTLKEIMLSFIQPNGNLAP